MPPKRASRPRSKGACDVCLQRRIKCDETKPSCSRCTTAGWTCAYKANAGNPTRSHTTCAVEGSPAFKALDTGIYSIPFKVPGSQFDRKALHYFCTLAATSFSGYLSSDFWDYHVLQRCQQEPVVRAAVVAVSLMHLEYATAEDLSVDGTLHRVSAETLDHHSKAIGKLRRYLEAGQSSTPPSETAVLTCCALFVCFDLMRGNHKEALQHLQSGVAVLRSWFQKPKRERECIGANAEQDRLVNIFSCLDLQATMYDDNRPPILVLANDSIDPLCGDSEPGHFANIEDAQRSLVTLLNRALAFLVQHTPYKLLDLCFVPLDMIFYRARIQTQFKDWAMALNSYENRSPADGQSRNSITVMRIQHHTMHLLLSGALGTQDCNLLFDRDALQLLQWSRSVVNGCNTAPEGMRRTFAVDVGLLPPLALLAFKTTSVAVRQETIELIARLPRMEGWYEAQAVASILQRLVGETPTPDISHDASDSTALRSSGLEVRAEEVMNAYRGEAIGFGKLQAMNHPC